MVALLHSDRSKATMLHSLARSTGLPATRSSSHR
jgi:hypothetical protein